MPVRSALGVLRSADTEGKKFGRVEEYERCAQDAPDAPLARARDPSGNAKGRCPAGAGLE
jgi:hypothetical protein